MPVGALATWNRWSPKPQPQHALTASATQHHAIENRSRQTNRNGPSSFRGEAKDLPEGQSLHPPGL